MKESLISLATFGYGNEAVAPNLDAVRIFEGFEEVLGRVLPPSIGFRRLVIRMPEVVFETGTGDFAFEAMSGGMAAIIDLSWQIYMRASVTPGCTVIIDEPENHLHPSLQQVLLPNFLEAFPDLQFVVATHNPLVVSSVPESHVYVLKHTDERDDRMAVRSQLLDVQDKAGTANQVLREVLGLPFTVPIWVAAELAQIVDRYGSAELTSETLKNLRAEMGRLGFDEFIPDTLGEIIERRPRRDDQAN
jgi:hypothetical protein